MSSASAIQSALTGLQQNNYGSLAMPIAIGYDCVLTFSNEIEYIWSKPWTWVSTLFIIVRYFGLFNAIVTRSQVGSSFLPGPEKVCKILYIMSNWTYALFLSAADFTMILRVWAMYNRSRLLLSALLVLFCLQIIFAVLTLAINNDVMILSVATGQILQFSFCVIQPPAALAIWTKVGSVLQMTQGAVLCILAIVQCVRQSLRMHHATKEWQLSRYMILLVKQGVLYFFAHVPISSFPLFSAAIQGRNITKRANGNFPS
ncbi:hypothetical protein OG21DRAFT_1513128 [Imleria badia]|nr:hypothetical protein OG21DRAFT_1513128 [Imleria badia]